MENLYWSCLAGGILFSIVSVIFGDIISHVLDGALDFLSVEGLPWLQPMSLVGGITAFGGVGILMEHYTTWPTIAIVSAALAGGLIIGAGAYFLYVKPMKRTENSTGFSIAELSGTIAEVLVPLPLNGYGEVMLKVGAGLTNQIAVSFDGTPIESGTRVVVVEVKEGILFVSKLEM